MRHVDHGLRVVVTVEMGVHVPVEAVGVQRVLTDEVRGHFGKRGPGAERVLGLVGGADGAGLAIALEARIRDEFDDGGVHRFETGARHDVGSGPDPQVDPVDVQFGDLQVAAAKGGIEISLPVRNAGRKSCGRSRQVRPGKTDPRTGSTDTSGRCSRTFIRERRQGDPDIGASEVRSLEQQRLTCHLGKCIGEAIAEVQRRRMVALSETAPRRAGR